MKKHTLILLTLSYSIIAIENATETMTVSTFFSNAWSGNITFRANAPIPIIEKDKKTFIIKGPGKFDDVTMACKVDKKNILNVNSFFELWANDVKKGFEVRIERELEKSDVISNLSVKDGYVVDKKSDKKLDCYICFNNILIKDATYYACCKTDDLPDILHKKCASEWENFRKQCPKCREQVYTIDELLEQSEKIENKRSLRQFNDFLKMKLSETGKAPAITGDFAFYERKKNRTKIYHIDNIDKTAAEQFFAHKETIPITHYMKPQSYFQAKPKGANKGRFLGISMNWERWHCFVPIFYSLTYCGLRSVADNDPESINAIKTTSLVGSLVLWLWVALWQKADYNKHKNKLVK